MKLCIVMTNLKIGGSERKMVKLANYLSDKGISVSILTLKFSRDEVLVGELNSSVKVLYFGSKLEFFRYLFVNKVDNFFLLNSYPLFFSFLFRVGNPRSRIFYLNNTSVYADGKLKLLLIKFSAMFCNGIVFGAKAQLCYWNYQYGFNINKSMVIYNGVDVECFKNDIELQSKFEIVMVGQVRPEKNYFQAVNCIKLLVDDGFDVSLNIVGGGKGLVQLRDYISNLNLTAYINLHGEVYDVKKYLEVARIFLLCSNKVETFSNAVLEAMSMGKIVIISDIGGAREMIDHGVNGYIFEVNNTEDLKQCIIKAFDDKSDLLANNARKTVLEKFTSINMMRSYMRLLK